MDWRRYAIFSLDLIPKNLISCTKPHPKIYFDLKIWLHFTGHLRREIEQIAIFESHEQFCGLFWAPTTKNCQISLKFQLSVSKIIIWMKFSMHILYFLNIILKKLICIFNTQKFIDFLKINPKIKFWSQKLP